MALYRNIAGSGGMGKFAPDAYFTRYDDFGGGGGANFYPVYTASPVASEQPVDVVFYDPGYVPENGYPSQEVVYDVRENEPVIPIQEVEPVQAAEVQTMVIDPEPVATTVDVQDSQNLFPLLTLALLAVTMVEGESLFGSNRGIVFAGGLGLLYYQLNKRAATPAD